jgi:hypothetical protein
MTKKEFYTELNRQGIIKKVVKSEEVTPFDMLKKDELNVIDFLYDFFNLKLSEKREEIVKELEEAKKIYGHIGSPFEAHATQSAISIVKEVMK